MTTTLVLRSVKSSPLTSAEVDQNFSNLKTTADTAYGWGDHSLVGYVTSSGNTIIGTDSDINISGATVLNTLTMTDGVITSHSTRTLTLADLGFTGATDANKYVLPFADNSNNWNTAYSWGDHGAVGYLTGITSSQVTTALGYTPLQTHQSLSAYATQTYVNTAVSNLVDSAPSTLDTLNELADALGDDPDFATTTATAIGNKLNASAVSSFGLTLIDDASASTARNTLGLGSAALSAASDFATSSQADQTVSLTGGGSTTISGTYPNFTITSAAGTAVGVSGDLSTGNVVLAGGGNTTVSKSGQTITISSTGANFTAGSGLQLIGTTFSNTAPDQTVSLTGSGATTISGTYPNFTISSTDTNTNLLSGGSVAGNLNLGDSNYLNIGDSNDLRLYHDSNDSYLEDQGDGSLIIKSDGLGIKLQSKWAGTLYDVIDALGFQTSIKSYGNTIIDVKSTGIEVAGNISATGTVDGRDVATDGTKLDTIATNADVTPSWVPSSNPNYLTSHQSLSGYATQSYVGTAISNLVDSAPTTLDTLNELAAALGDDANFSTTITTSIGTKWTQDNTKISQWDTAYGWGDHSTQGYITSADGGNADTVDSLHASSFLRSDASDNYTSGTLTFNSGTGFDLATGDVYGSMRVIRNNKSGSDGMYIGYLNTNSGLTRIFGGGQGSGGIYITGSGANDVKYNNSSSFWHAGNDGSGSGLDSDLLDGQHGSYYLNYNNFSNTPSIPSVPVTSYSNGADNRVITGTSSSGINGESTFTYNGTSATLYGSGLASEFNVYHSDGAYTQQVGYGIRFSRSASYLQPTSSDAKTLYIGGNVPDAADWINVNVNVQGNNNLKVRGNTVWNAGNDGSGSGLDSDLLDGQQGSYYQNASNINSGTLNAGRLPDVVFKSYTNSDGGWSQSNRNFSVRSGGDAVGLHMEESDGTFGFQLYGNSSTYGFLDGEWASWDIQKTVNGAFKVDEGSGLKRVLNEANWSSYISVPSVGNGTLTMLPGNSLTGSGTFTANQSGDTTITLAVDTPDDAGTSGWYQLVAWNNQLIKDADVKLHGAGYVMANYFNIQHGVGTRNSDDVFYSSNDTYLRKNNAGGFRTSLDVYNKSEVNALIPSVGNGTLTINTSGSASGGGTFTANQSGNSTITITGTGITSYTETDTLSSVTGRGASTSTKSTFSGGASISGTSHTRTIPTKWYGTAYTNTDIDYYEHNYAKAQLGNTYKYTTSRPAITSDSNYWVGTMGWGNIDLNTIFSYGSGFWDSWSSPSNAPSGTSHWQGINALHYSANTGNSQYGMQITMGAGNTNLMYVRGIWGGGFGSWQKMWNAGNDGSGSGLDADLLDGQQGSYYAPASTVPTVHNGQLTVQGAGSVSGSGTFTANQSGNTTITLTGSTDASTLDGIDSGSFLRSDTSDTFGSTSANQYIRFNVNSGQYIASSGSSSRFPIEIFAPTTNGGDAGIAFHISGDYAGFFGLASDWNDLAWGGWSVGSTTKYRIAHTGNLSTTLSGYWNSSNDGSGSGLDADFFDGRDSAHYVFGTDGYGTTNSGFASLTNAKSGFYDVHNSGTPTSTWYSLVNMAHYGANHGHQIAGSFYSHELHHRYNNNTSLSSWSKIWSSLSDGSGSGLDADTTDGLHVHNTQGTQNSANQILRTQANGYTHLGWINTTSGAFTSAMDRIYCSNDAYIRYQTPSNFGANISQYINYNNIANKPTIPSVGNGTITIAAGTNMSGGGTFSVNQSGNTTITLNSTASGGGSGSFNGGTVTGNTFFNTSNMKVGIRTGSPAAALDVNGTIKAQSLNVNDKLLMVAQPTSLDQGYLQSDAYGHGGHFGHYIENGVTASDGNSYTIGDVNSVTEYTAGFGKLGKIVEDVRVRTVRLTFPSYNWLYTYPKRLVEVPYFQTQIKPILQILSVSVFVDMLNGQSGGAGLTNSNHVDLFQVGYWRDQQSYGQASTNNFQTFKPVFRFPKGIYNANLKDASGTPANFYYAEMERDPVNGGVAYPDHDIFLSSNTHDWGNQSSNQNSMVFTLKVRYKLIHPSGDFNSALGTTYGGG